MAECRDADFDWMLWRDLQKELEDDLKELENHYRSDKSLSEDVRKQLDAITAAFRCGGPQSSVMIILGNKKNAGTDVAHYVQSPYMLTGRKQWDPSYVSVMKQTVERNKEVLTPVLRQFYEVIGPTPKWQFLITEKVKKEHLVIDKGKKEVKKALDNDERSVMHAINGIFDQIMKIRDSIKGTYCVLEITKIEKGQDDDSEKMKIDIMYGWENSFIQIQYGDLNFLYWHGDFEKNKEKLSKLLNQHHEYQPDAPPNYVTYQLAELEI